eukprot:5894062-Lingulodinium_polyedra.AAC.1
MLLLVGCFLGAACCCWGAAGWMRAGSASVLLGCCLGATWVLLKCCLNAARGLLGFCSGAA